MRCLDAEGDPQRIARPPMKTNDDDFDSDDLLAPSTVIDG